MMGKQYFVLLCTILGSLPRQGWVERGLSRLHVTPQERECECPAATDHLIQSRTAIQIKTTSILLLFHKARISEGSNGQRTTCLPRIIPWRQILHAHLAVQSAGIALQLAAV